MRRILTCSLWLALALPPALARAQQTYDGALARGIAAYKAGQFAEAAEAFEQAHALDPQSTSALVDLASTYAAQVLPNVATDENLTMANKAITLFRDIPANDQHFHTALKQIAALYRNTRRLDDARDAELQALKLEPDDPETLYTIGVIDWMQAYTFAITTLATAGLADDGVGNPRLPVAACQALRTHNGILVEDGIARLTQAVSLRPTYTDAMQYLNLMYRRKADLACNNPSARAQDISAANQWTRKAVDLRQRSGP